MPARDGVEGPNHVRTFPALSPVNFLERSGAVFADRLAITDGEQQFTYGEFLDRCRRLADSLREQGVGNGSRVCALCVNSHVMLELHNAVPGCGAVLVPLNIRLAPPDLEGIIRHAGASLLIADPECESLARAVSAAVGIRLVLSGAASEYEALVASGTPEPLRPREETDLLAINYTSGSTGTPKGVMYNHRGAFLQALAMAYHLGLSLDSSYLWTLPMFHCDGWCHTWAVTAAGAVHRCVRKIDAPAIWETIASGAVTHLAAAPIVLTMIAEAAANDPERRPPHPVSAATGGAPPTPTLVDRLDRLGVTVSHLYGLTETYGPVIANQWQPEWSAQPAAQRFFLSARQGIGNIVTSEVRVVDADGKDVASDATAIGEIIIRSNNVMVGYYRDPAASEAALVDGWLHTGDLAVRHPDGYLEVRDRAKDIVIVGGENVSSVEVERVICEHSAVLEAAVVSLPDEHWGEVPVAIVVLRDHAVATEAEIIEHVRARTAHFKAPKRVHFAPIPKTSTGKVQKHVLREWVRAMR